MQEQNKLIEPIKRCRLCNSKNVKVFINFKKNPLGNNLQLSALRAKNAKKYLLKVNRCKTCGHFQLSHSVSPKLLYATNYTYLSGVGPSFLKHINKYVTSTINACRLKNNSIIVDIGSNDGTCLKEFQLKGYRVCGIDPAKIPASIANASGVFTINGFFNKKTAAEIQKKYGEIDLITSQNVLAHVDNLEITFKLIYSILKSDGYLSFEVGYFANVLESNYFDTIYHEHLDYHHAEPLANHLTRLGFNIVKISTNKVQGGSLRILARKTGAGLLSRQSRDFISKERNLPVFKKSYINEWQNSITNLMSSFYTHIKSLDSKKKIIGYGAPTKATLLLSISKINPTKIAFIADDNIHKTGRFMPGSAIPIMPTLEIQTYKPDVIIILAWNFADDIILKLKKMKIKTQILIPLPMLRIVNI
jgi:SAM-dependent methyltransferase